MKNKQHMILWFYLKRRAASCMCLIVRLYSAELLFMWTWMSDLIQGNAPDLRDRRKKATHRAVAVTVDSPRAEFSWFLSGISSGEKKKKKTPLTFYGETLQKRALTFYGREISGRAAPAIMRSHVEWSGAESQS